MPFAKEKKDQPADLLGNLGIAPDTAQIGQNGGAAGGVPSSEPVDRV